MPKKVLPSIPGFKLFCDDEEKEGYKVLDREATKAILPYKISAEKLFNKHVKENQKGLQIVLRYFMDPFVALLLTTVTEEYGAKESDEGWMLIIDLRFPRNPSFYSFPLRRTENFLKTFRQYAAAAKKRINTMPCCPECGTLLRIILIKSKDPTRKNMHKYALVCPNKNYKHEKPPFHNFYLGMKDTDIDRKFLESVFGRYDSYVSKEEEQGTDREADKMRRVNRNKGKEKKTNIQYVPIEDGPPLE